MKITNKDLDFVCTLIPRRRGEGVVLFSADCVYVLGGGSKEKHTGAYRGEGGQDLEVFLRTYVMDNPLHSVVVSSIKL